MGRRLTKYALVSLAATILLVLPKPRAATPSLGEKIKEIFVSPTPTPGHRTKHRKPYSSPSPSVTPTPSPKGKSKKKHQTPTPSPSPTASETATPTPTPTISPSPSPTEGSSKTRVATISPNEIRNYEKNPEKVRKLLDDALALTTRNLDYSYGSADPSNGGMDCSGFIYFVLRKNGMDDVPRDASQQYVWVRKAGNFRAVLSRDPESFELDELAPGDLLFWSGTYSVERDPPVTHTMIYLGKEKASGKPIMVGASDGRTYHGEKQFGVSVFDFRTTPANAARDSERQPRFVGYGKIPGFESEKP